MNVAEGERENGDEEYRNPWLWCGDGLGLEGKKLKTVGDWGSEGMIDRKKPKVWKKFWIAAKCICLLCLSVSGTMLPLALWQVPMYNELVILFISWLQMWCGNEEILPSNYPPSRRFATPQYRLFPWQSSWVMKIFALWEQSSLETRSHCAPGEDMWNKVHAGQHVQIRNE